VGVKISDSTMELGKPPSAAIARGCSIREPAPSAKAATFPTAQAVSGKAVLELFKCGSHILRDRYATAVLYLATASWCLTDGVLDSDVRKFALESRNDA
jgi:hypothetical protein